jgi:hypothetical protein
MPRCPWLAAFGVAQDGNDTRVDKFVEQPLGLPLTERSLLGYREYRGETTLALPRQQNEICRTEELPSKWQDFAEAKGVPEEQIFKSWRRFKDQTVQPYQLKNWLGWLGRERVKA